MWCRKRTSCLPSRMSISFEETTYINKTCGLVRKTPPIKKKIQSPPKPHPSPPKPRPSPCLGTCPSPPRFQRQYLSKPPALPSSNKLPSSGFDPSSAKKRSKRSKRSKRHRHHHHHHQKTSVPTISEQAVQEHKMRILKDFTKAPNIPQPNSPMAKSFSGPSRPPIPLNPYQRTFRPITPNQPYPSHFEPRNKVGHIFPSPITVDSGLPQIKSQKNKKYSKRLEWYDKIKDESPQENIPSNATSYNQSHSPIEINNFHSQSPFTDREKSSTDKTHTTFRPVIFDQYHVTEHQLLDQKLNEPSPQSLTFQDSLEPIISEPEQQELDSIQEISPMIKISRRKLSEYTAKDLKPPPESSTSSQITKHVDESMNKMKTPSINPVNNREQKKKAMRKIMKGQKEERRNTRKQIKKNKKGFFNWLSSKFRRKKKPTQSELGHNSQPFSNKKSKFSKPNENFPSRVEFPYLDPILNSKQYVDKHLSGLIPRVILGRMSLGDISSTDMIEPKVNVKGYGRRNNAKIAKNIENEISLPIQKMTRAQIFRNEFIKKKLTTTENSNVKDSWWKNFNSKMLPCDKV